jgi:hypothetical protein
LRGATCPACRQEFRPLARQLPPRFLFIVHAALYRLINGEAGGGGNVELATAGDIELRHGAFTVSLVDFARELRIALSEFDHFG